MQTKPVLEIIKELSIDAVLISDGYNMRYISGFSGATGYLFISKSKKVLITDSRYTTQALKEARGFEIIEISLDRTYIDIVEELVKEEQVFNFGFENNSISYHAFNQFEQRLTNMAWIPLNEKVDSLRMVKSEQEIQKLKIAESIGDFAFSKILDIIKPGITELDVAAELEYIMKKNGAENLSFDTIVASGLNSSMPHATPGKKIIENGDFVTMDFGCIFEGYCSDMTRTVVVGRANEKQKEIYDIVLNANLKALEYVSSEKLASDVDSVARDYIKEHHYGEYFGHGLGHGVGLFIHEEPRLSRAGNVILKENMIVTIEPGIYIPDFGGVRIEDMIVVKKDGYINLANSPKQLIEL